MAITRSSQVQPDIVGAWGAFGLVFTGIAAAHTLYAPREVVLWNWKRICLMGVAIALCIGSQWALWVVLLPTLAFMLWVGHVRPGAALAVFTAACAVGLFALGVRQLSPVRLRGRTAKRPLDRVLPSPIFRQGQFSILGLFFMQNGLGPAILLLVSLMTFVVWKRAATSGLLLRSSPRCC